MGELRTEVGVTESLKKTLARSRLTWAGLVEKRGNENLAAIADAQKVEGKEGEGDRNCDGGLH